MSANLAETLREFKDLNRFSIIQRVAEGGMGSVYEALQHGSDGFNKTVALKMINQEFSNDPEFVDMFIGEAKLVANLVHQNIVQIYQLGKSGPNHYIAMEYIYGINLEQFIDRHLELNVQIPVEWGAYITSRVARALEYAHNQRDRHGNPLNVVHRDVSPKNIMINTEGFVKLGDFGIAKARNIMASNEGEVLMGKAPYMSPEQAKFMETDHRSDVFSLACVMYELLSNGKVLFEGEDTTSTLANVISMDVPSIRLLNPKVPGELDEILNKALEKDRDERYQTAGMMAYDLEYYMYHDRFGPEYTQLAKYIAELFPEVAQTAGGNSKLVYRGLPDDKPTTFIQADN